MPPSLIFPNGDKIKKKMINVKADIEIVNKVPNLYNNKIYCASKKLKRDIGIN